MAKKKDKKKQHDAEDQAPPGAARQEAGAGPLPKSAMPRTSNVKQCSGNPDAGLA